MSKEDRIISIASFEAASNSAKRWFKEAEKFHMLIRKAPAI